jgi:hypothetical protein
VQAVGRRDDHVHVGLRSMVPSKWARWARPKLVTKGSRFTIRASHPYLRFRWTDDDGSTYISGCYEEVYTYMWPS